MCTTQLEKNPRKHFLCSITYRTCPFLTYNYALIKFSQLPDEMNYVGRFLLCEGGKIYIICEACMISSMKNYVRVCSTVLKLLSIYKYNLTL